MLDFKETAFIPGTPLPLSIPLERYLPPISSNVYNRWLINHIEPGSWVLDPFGSHPWLPIETARTGYSILMACNNPIVRLITEVLCDPPGMQEYQAAISELLTLKRGDLRLEQSLQALYESTCPSCASAIQPEAFLWRKDEDEPFAKLITCPFCGDAGEKKLSLEDKERIRLIGNDPLFWRRAINRVAQEDEEISGLISEAVRVYLPRQLYFLMSLLNKTETIRMDDRKKVLIQAMLLHLFDKGNILWNWPVSRSRPKSLVSPSQFREDNLWLEIVNSHRIWTSNNSPVELTIWPALPSSPGICIFPGRLKDLGKLPPEKDIRAVLAVIPRPNQAFWTLSAIWSGWLWGRDSVTPLKSAIERRRYDWKWHTYALHSNNASLTSCVTKPTPYFAAVPELVPRFWAAVTASSCSTGFRIEGVSLRDQAEEAQITWEISGPKSIRSNILLNSLCEYSLSRIFAAVNEPLSYNHLHTHFFSTLAFYNFFEKKDPRGLSIYIDQAESTLHKIIGDPSLYRRYGSESQNLDSGLYWPKGEESFAILPLVDRVETAVFLYAEKNFRIRLEDTYTYICNLFPGVTTPSLPYVKSCIESYCTQTLPDYDYVFNEKERTINREKEVSELMEKISQLGERFGFITSGTRPLQWMDDKGHSVYDFYFARFATIGDDILKSTFSGGKRVIIFPGSRSALLSIKLKRDPRVLEKAQGWIFVKFRHIRKILELEGLILEYFSDLIERDPVSLEETGQPKIFDLSL